MVSLLAPEPVRLAALNRLSLRDVPRHAALDLVVDVAGQFLQRPVATIALVHEQKVRLKARTGLAVGEVDRAQSLCNQVIRQPEPFHVPDTWADARFATNPHVVGPPHVRSFSGVPLCVGREKAAVGALCVMDTRDPRTLTPQDQELLQALGGLASAVLEAPDDPSQALSHLFAHGAMALVQVSRSPSVHEVLASPRLLAVSGLDAQEVRSAWLDHLLCLDRPYRDASLLRHAIANHLPAHGLTRLRRRQDPAGAVCRFVLVPLDLAGAPALAVLLLPAADVLDMDTVLLSEPGINRRAAINEAFDGVWRTDDAHRLRLLAVRQGHRLLSLLPDDLASHPHWWEVPGFESPDGWSVLRAVAGGQGGLAAPQRLYWRAQDRWLEVVPVSQGEQASTMGLIRDITRACKAEMALRASEERFRDFARLSSDWLWELDGEQRFCLAEGALERPLGVASADLIGRTCEEASLLSTDPQPLLELGQACRSGSPMDLLLEVKADPRESRWLRVHGTPVQRADGRGSGWRGTGRDVTSEQNRLRADARELAQARLEQGRMQAILDEMSAGVIVRDWERLSYCNPAFARLLGYTHPSELIGRPMEDFIQEADLERSRTGFRATLEGHIRSVVRHMMRADGRSVRVLISPVRVTWGGQPQGLGVVQPLDTADLLGIEVDSGLRSVLSMVLGEVHERQRRVAHTLHEELGSDLTAISLLIGALAMQGSRAEGGAPELARRLSQPLDLLAGAIGKVRDLAQGLEPVESTPDGFRHALRKLAREVYAREGLLLAFRPVDDLDTLSPLDRKVAYQVVCQVLFEARAIGHIRQLRLRMQVEAQQVLMLFTFVSIDPSGKTVVDAGQVQRLLVAGADSVSSVPGRGGRCHVRIVLHRAVPQR